MKSMITRSLALCGFVTAGCFCSFAQAKDKEQVIEVPFDYYRNEIIVQVTVNGKGPFNMMLDTGTDPSVIDIKTAQELGLKLKPLGKPATGGGTDVNLVYYSPLRLVELGGLRVRDLETVAIDLSKVSQRLQKPLHGVLGHSLLHGRIVQIDYPNHIVRFYSRSPFSKTTKQPNTSKRTVLSFRYSNGVLIDDVSVNGKKVVANVDTGSSGIFDVTPAAVSYLGLEEEVSRATAGTDVGYNGVSENRKGKLGNVTIGGISVDAPEVTFFGKGQGRDNRPWGINIGNAFLKDFVVTIDYPDRLITLERP